MNKIFQLSALSLFLTSTNLYAHHPAADIVDEDIYAMIDSIVTDTPHVSLTFDEMAGGMTETIVTADSLPALETLIVQDDLLEYVELLDGLVAVDISFNNDNSVTMTVNQVKQA
jgi:hypothetical protein